MNAQAQIKEHIASHSEPKRSDMQQLHDLILGVNPGCKLWFLDGKDANGKVVSNPDIGFGSRDHKYADGTISEFYQIGLSPNKTGICVHTWFRRQDILERDLWKRPRQSERDRVLHQVQNSKRYRH